MYWKGRTNEEGIVWKPNGSRARPGRERTRINVGVRKGGRLAEEEVGGERVLGN
jgi:hypothetical protein